MKIIHKLIGKALYIGLSGELDESEARGIRETLDTLIDTPNIIKVVIELSELSFMDSTGIGVILGRFKKLKARGVPLIIANPSRAVDKILRISGIYQYMPKMVY